MFMFHAQRCASLLLLLNSPMLWAEAQQHSTTQWSSGPLELNLGLGYLTGRSQEKVYDTSTGAKISQLFWDIEQAPTLHAGVTLEPLPRLSLALKGWSKLDSGNSTMRDYDWLSEQSTAWSDLSTHPDTRLMRAYQLEFTATAWVLREADWQLGMLAGYQKSHFKWEAKGGSYIYSSESGFRDEQGNFPDGELGITYQQTFKAPFIGITAGYQWQSWSLDASIKGSRWVTANDFDTHHQRDTTFAGTGNDSRLFAATLGLGYALNAQLSVQGQLDYQEYSEGKGKVRINEAGQTSVEQGDAGGMANRTSQASLGLSYSF